MTKTWCPVCKTDVETIVDEDSLSRSQKTGGSIRCKICNAEIFLDCGNQQQYLRRKRKEQFLKGFHFMIKAINSIIVGPLVYILGAILMLFLLLLLMSVLNE